MSNEFRPHSEKQEKAIFSDTKITFCGTGIQWGKSRVGAVRMKLRMHEYTAADDAFIICAPTYKIMEQSTLPAFKAIMRDYWDGNYNASKAEFRMPGGGTCYFRTATDPDSVVGITNVRHIWGDEAGKFGLYFWENLQARASYKQCQIDLTTSPYSLNFLYKEFVRPKLKDPSNRPDCLWIAATSAENPYFSVDEYNSKRETMDPRRFNAIYGGRWEKMAGLVYDTFDEVDNQCEPFELPAGTRVVAGVDWGFTAPFAMTVRAITPNGNHFQVSETYKTGLSISQRLDIAKQKKQIWGIKLFWCDPEEPAMIKEFNENGLPAAPADNNIRAGIDAHYELVKSKRYKIFRGSSPYTIDEYDAYHYPSGDDLGPDDNEKEQKPVAQNNHAMDSNRYISIMEKKTGLRQTTGTRVPQDGEKKEDQFDRIERLKRKPRNNHSEKW